MTPEIPIEGKMAAVKASGMYSLPSHYKRIALVSGDAAVPEGRDAICAHGYAEDEHCDHCTPTVESPREKAELPELDVTTDEQILAGSWTEGNPIAGTYRAALQCRERQLLAALEEVRELKEARERQTIVGLESEQILSHAKALGFECEKKAEGGIQHYVWRNVRAESAEARVRELAIAAKNIRSLARPHFSDATQILALNELGTALSNPIVLELLKGGK